MFALYFLRKCSSYFILSFMKKILFCALSGLVFTANAQNVYQVQNSDFEEWEEVSYTKKGMLGSSTTITGNEPLHWSSFLTGTGKWKSTAGANQVEKSTEVRPGSTGKQSVKIFDRNVLAGIIAQGNLTTGCINMGSMSAADANGNYNYTNTDDEAFNQKFTGRPDAMVVWVKFVASGSNKAKVNTILHTDGYYQDPEGNTITATVIAKAENTSIASSNDWQKLTIPFDYKNEGRPAYALVSFASSNMPGKGAVGNYMLIDDLEYIYNYSLTSATYGATSLTVPAAGETADCGTLTYDESTELTLTTDGAGASVEKAYDEENCVLTVTVKADDYEVSKHKNEYKFQFAKPVNYDYTEPLYVTLGGETMGPQSQGIFLKENENGTYRIAIEDFSLMGMLPVGDIVLDNVTATVAGDQIQYSAKALTTITSENPDALGPQLGEIPIELKARTAGGRMWASILIPMGEDLGNIVVTIGDNIPTIEITGAEVYNATNVNHNNVVTLDYMLGTCAHVEIGDDVTEADLNEVAATQTQFCLVYNDKLAGTNVVNTTTKLCKVLSLPDAVSSFEIKEGNFTAQSVKVARTFTATGEYVSSFIVPFELKASEVKGKLYLFKGINGDNVEFLKLENDDTMLFNRPCLIVAESEHPFDGVKNVVVGSTTYGPFENTVGNAAHIGTYTTQTVTSDATATYYGYQNGEFVKANNGTLNPFRTMIKVTGTVTAQALKLKLNDETTGISEAASEAGKADVYTIDGKCVRRGVAAKEALNGLAKGVYVVNGRKIVK